MNTDAVAHSRSDTMTPAALAYDFSHQWFRDGSGRDIFEWDGISLGLVAQLAVYDVILSALRKSGGVETTPGGESLRGWLVRKLKDACLDWPLKAALARVSVRRMAELRRTPRATPYLFVYDVWNTGMIESLALVQARVAEQRATAAVVFEERVFRRLRAYVDTPAYMYPVGFRAAPSQASDIHRHIRRAYRQHRSAVAERVRQLVPEAAGMVMARLDRVVRRFYRQTAADLVRWREFLLQVSPETVALASDSHKMARLVVLLCRRLGIRTLVVQHGATVSPHAYVPVYADRMAVWGDLSRQWFERFGVPSERLVVTGNPRLDRLRSVHETESSDEEAVPGILVATQPVGKEEIARFLDVVTEALVPLGSDVRVTVKLHPGERHDAYIRSRIAAAAPEWMIVRHADLYQLLRKHALVVTMQSTVGIEAIAAGKMLVVVDVPGVPRVIPYADYGCAPMVSDAADLQMAVSRFLGRDSSLAHYRTNAESFIRDYLHKLDGRAADRISKELMAISGGDDR